MFVSLAAVATTIVYAQDSSIVFYPPQDDASDQIPSFEVTAGDTINITWSATFQSVDLHIEAWAPDSNFSVTPYYNRQSLPSLADDFALTRPSRPRLKFLLPLRPSATRLPS